MYRNQISLTKKEARPLRAPMMIKSLIMKEILRTRENINMELKTPKLILKTKLKKLKRMRLLLRKTSFQSQSR
jgi:hypothetical protein